ncbi:MAG: hypothetical protein AMXMBFR61_10760 [Fimbriimonadales bacterium]
MTASLIHDCLHYGAILDAYVVLSSHWHAILRVPTGRSIAWLMARLKSNAAKRLLSALSAEVLEELGRQSGSNERVLWDRSYRSFPINRDSLFRQKADYIHNNPVRAGLVALQSEYRWSSAFLYDQGVWSEERGLHLDPELVRYYCSPELLVIKGGSVSVMP